MSMKERDQGFIRWKKEVDDCIGRICGLSSDDLPDVEYYDLYESEVSPQEMAAYVLNVAGFYD